MMSYLDSLELEHYGILGMKWGVRRTPEQLGHRTSKTGEREYVPHSIKAGTKLYRVTSESGRENVKGSTYFTMLPPDRDFYRGSYSQVISKQQGGNGQAYESTYKTNKELKIANREDLVSEYNAIIKNEKLIRTMMLDYSVSLIDKDVKLGRLEKSEAVKKGSEYLSREVMKFTQGTSGMRFTTVSRGLTVSTPVVRESMIQSLKKKGFHGYIDEAGVGGVSSVREGVEPLVIFDAEKNVTPQSSTKLTPTSMNRADMRYSEWSRIANSRKNYKNPW